ncbi:LytR C-terminal domain-containing protein [Nocardioides campestrisoli]|uniref:LytR C-terminal domain-containing protein n=1 Tax=Nocardioides campestrisoli TaxID=2736757 RepID=UPI0015E695E7|nr:LytR C-terminal domain-containing protein [Nocardioides campestrisoli]
MTARIRSALTLTALVVLLLGSVMWGWSSLTRPLPQSVEVPVCTDTSVSKGTLVSPDMVAVSVYNASKRNGLASKTLSLLVTRGFVPADTGNAPEGTSVKGVQIWAKNKNNPAVQLVGSHFRNARVVEGPDLGPGVVVVVGDGFTSLRGAKKSPETVGVESNATICMAPEQIS